MKTFSRSADLTRLLALGIGMSVIVASIEGVILRQFEYPAAVRLYRVILTIIFTIFAIREKFVLAKPFRFAHMKPFIPLAASESLRLFAISVATRFITSHSAILVSSLTTVIVLLIESPRLSVTLTGKPLTGAPFSSTLVLRIIPWVSFGCSLVFSLEANWSPWALTMLCLAGIVDVYCIFIRQSIATNNTIDLPPTSCLLYANILDFITSLILSISMNQFPKAFYYFIALPFSTYFLFLLLGLTASISHYALWQLYAIVPATTTSSLADLKRCIVFVLHLAATSTTVSPISLLSLFLSASLSLCLVHATFDVPQVGLYTSLASSEKEARDKDKQGSTSNISSHNNNNNSSSSSSSSGSLNDGTGLPLESDSELDTIGTSSDSNIHHSTASILAASKIIRETSNNGVYSGVPSRKTIAD